MHDPTATRRHPLVTLVLSAMLAVLSAVLTVSWTDAQTLPCIAAPSGDGPNGSPHASPQG